MSHDIGDLVLAQSLALDFAEFESSLFGVDLVSYVPAFDIVEHAEELASLFNANDVLETEWVSMVFADSVIDFDETFLVLHDLDHLIVGHCVLKSLLQQHSQWNALSQFVGAGAGAWSVNAIKFAQHPVRRCGHSLQMLLKSSCLDR